MIWKNQTQTNRPKKPQPTKAERTLSLQGNTGSVKPSFCMRLRTAYLTMQSHYTSMLEKLINIRAVTCCSAVEQKPLLGHIPKFCEIKI